MSRLHEHERKFLSYPARGRHLTQGWTEDLSRGFVIVAPDVGSELFEPAVGGPPGDEEGPAAAVLQALRSGDRRGALSLLMKAYGAAIYRFCRGALQDPALADDVHQLVFLSAYESLPTFEQRSSLAVWLYGIARHRCLEAMRARRRFRLRFLFGDPPDEPADPGPHQDESLQQQALRTALSACLKKTPPHIRMAVLLRHGEGLTCEDIARMCGERATTVQKRVARALPALRRCLEAREQR